VSPNTRLLGHSCRSGKGLSKGEGLTWDKAGSVNRETALILPIVSGVDPMLMAVAINSGISAGGLAPTSLFGIVTNTTARHPGIDLNPLVLLPWRWLQISP
jgi:hypothetical protein